MWRVFNLNKMFPLHPYNQFTSKTNTPLKGSKSNWDYIFTRRKERGQKKKILRTKLALSIILVGFSPIHHVEHFSVISNICYKQRISFFTLTVVTNCSPFQLFRYIFQSLIQIGYTHPPLYCWDPNHGDLRKKRWWCWCWCWSPRARLNCNFFPSAIPWTISIEQRNCI